MAIPLAASIVDLLLASKLGPSAAGAGNRFLIEGATWQPGNEGAGELGIQRLEASALHLSSGPLVLEIDHIVLHKLVAQVQSAVGAPRLSLVRAAQVELSGVKIGGPLLVSPQIKGLWDAVQAGRAPAPVADIAAGGAPARAWSLEPLTTADGTIHATITDAHLLFDADVTVPIRHGQVDFNDATVEHVGPDSRMGVSRMGFYVDAPNGRSYVYQFASAPLAGVEFEERGTLLGPWVSERGKVWLQPFAEAMLQRGPASRAGPGLTEQARQLLGRTALAGELQLADGRFVAPGVQARTEGRAQGRNAIRLSSRSVGSGLGAQIASLAVRDALAAWGGGQCRCDSISAALELQLTVSAGAQIGFELKLAMASLESLGVEFGESARAG
ncbi:hypothetical protein [Variovorax sp. OV329]|uniref:hypothetical protein n=1 Tax=Variovorax sp. OV329 TaxID=1882825 RepID=UPI0008F3E98D|nr:hypothetical protein [Variovorax sp. OV329]SFL86664.1 hypothetical protein SAMN05444747_10138 [Variovorax sp. OV329]